MHRRRFLLAMMAREDARAVALRLAAVYGQTISAAVYTETFALVGRQRLGQGSQVAALLEPYLNGAADSLANPTPSHYSGHLPFADLDDPRAQSLLRRAAALAAENPLDNEMSDSVFMVCPLLVRAGRFDGAAAHFAKMESLCLRKDGLYRHSPLADVAWGRGNAFPLLGLALMLTHWPQGHAAHSRLLAAYRHLAETLLGHQGSDGMWRQVVDMPQAWPEYSCTAMIGAAIARGIAQGWLPRAEYRPAVDRAWAAIEKRTGADGSVTGVCESTGKLPSLAAYLGRRSLDGRDARGGAMGLFFATELL
jgi:unsaturated rhamnogalacturonyl hydrolase